jgi:hypothetical protein
MTSVRRSEGGVLVSLVADELAALTEQELALLAVLDDEQGPEARRPLFPDAYRGSPDDAAEFHELMDEDLASAKRDAAGLVLHTFVAAGPSDASAPASRGRHARRTPAQVYRAEFDHDTLPSLVRNLTDLRLLLAARLGIEEDGDRGHTGRGAAHDRNVYAWLGGIQELVVDALLHAPRAG